MLATRFTELVGCAVPIQLAPMGGVGTIELVAAVTGAGGMGMMASAGMPAPALGGFLDAAAARGAAPVGVNFLMPFLDHEAVVVAAAKAGVVDFYHGDPEAALVKLVHGAGALCGWQVGSLAEARAAVEAGCDLLVVRGIEGGGRMWGSSSVWPLLAAVLDAVDVPVLAAGGIGTARGLAAALAAGADGVRMGTRFLATEESGAHPVYKEAVIAASPEDTVLTDAFSVMWPPGPQPHRVLRSAVEAAGRLGGEPAGRLPLGGQVFDLPAFAVPAPTRDATGHIEAMALYAGESVGAVDRVEPAARVVADLVAGAEALLRRWSG